MTTAAQRRYWTALVRDGCVLCGAPAEIAHAHGGSIVERMQEPKAKGVKLERYDWLVLPLCPAHHRSEAGCLDNSPRAWEAVHGEQAAWIDLLCHRHGLDLWRLASPTKEAA